MLLKTCTLCRIINMKPKTGNLKAHLIEIDFCLHILKLFSSKLSIYLDKSSKQSFFN